MRIDYEPHLSPDGRWIAYTTTESGTREVHIAAFPTFDNSRQVSAGGGYQPRWRGDGRELSYLGADKALISLPVSASGTLLETKPPTPLFVTRVPAPGADYYAPSADGRRFLVLSPIQEDRPTPLTVVLNWTAMLSEGPR